MVYISYETLCKDIRENLRKVPRDICGVVGVPRSGMLPATIIAESLNVGLTTIDNVIQHDSVIDALAEHGGRKLWQTHGNRLLVVDDTLFHGNAMNAAKSRLLHPAFSGYEIIYLVVYLEGAAKWGMPDIYLRDIREEAKGGPFGWALYEWNIFAHGRLTDRTLFDLDGVICCEPPDERLTEWYEAYITNPTPLHVPTGNISICTYRLEKYRNKTLEGLSKLGVSPVYLYMSQAASYEDRKHQPSWQHKASVYKDDKWLLFVESSEWQAQKIYEVTGKPVISIETNKLYTNQ